MADLPRKREGAIYPKTLKELRDLSDEDLIALHDQMVGLGGYTVGLDYYPQELARREQDRQTRTMVRLTKFIGVLTVVNLVAVIVTAILAT
jgi:hypothetical protein